MVRKTSRGTATLRNIIFNQFFSVLATTDANNLYCSLISFSISDDLKTIVFATSRNTQKYRNILQNPSVSMLIDNRTNQPSDVSESRAITVVGSAFEISDGKEKYADQLLLRHPGLRYFIEQADTAIITVGVSHYFLSGFNRTKRITVD